MWHKEVKEWCDSLAPPCKLKWRMTNINMKVISTSPSYVCGGRREAAHAHSLALPRSGVAKYAGARCSHAWFAEIHLLPCGGA